MAILAALLGYCFGVWVIICGLAILLGFIVAFCFFKPRRDWEEFAARDQPDGQIAELAKGQTFYRLEGPTDGQLVVLLHGVSFFSFVWAPLRTALVALNYRVLTFDFYGHGYSAIPDEKHNVSLLVEQTRALLESLKLHKQPAIFIGHSMGAFIAVHYASAYPDNVAKLAIISPAGYPDCSTIPLLNPYNWMPLMIQSVLSLVQIPMLGEFLASIGTFCIWQLIYRVPPTYSRLLRSTAQQDQSRVSMFLPLKIAHQLRFLYEVWAFQMMVNPKRDFVLLTIIRDMSDVLLGLAGGVDTFECVGEDDRPLMVMWGNTDFIVPVVRANALQKSMPKAQIAIIDGGDHMLLHTHQKQVHSRITDFLSRPIAELSIQ